MMTSNSLMFIIMCLAINQGPTLAFTLLNIAQTKITNHMAGSINLVPVRAQKEDDSLFDAEDAAAFDAHDLSDPGMEAAAMERAVMMAEEFKRNQSKTVQNVPKEATVEAEEENTMLSETSTGNDNDSLLDAEDVAAFDAHDLSDPGMEAAAMERAVMMAEEMKLRKKSE